MFDRLVRLKRLLDGKMGTGKPHGRRKPQLHLERLEDRTVPSHFQTQAISGSAFSHVITFFPPPDTTFEVSASGTATNSPTPLSVGVSDGQRVDAVTDAGQGGYYAQMTSVAGVYRVDGGNPHPPSSEADSNGQLTMSTKLLPDAGESLGDPIFLKMFFITRGLQGGSASASLGDFEGLPNNSLISGHIGNTYEISISTAAAYSGNDVSQANGFGLVELFPTTATFVPDAGGPYSLNEGQSLSLDGSRTSNPNSLPLTFSWDVKVNGTWKNGIITGKTATLDSALLQSLGVTAAGSPYQIRVEVTDTKDGITVTSQPTKLTVKEAAATITPTSPQWNAAQGGLDFSYTIANGPTPKASHIGGYWADANGKLLEALTDPVYYKLIPSGTTDGASVHIAPNEFLHAPPAGATQFVLIGDPNMELGSVQPKASVPYNPMVTVTDDLNAQESGSPNTFGRFFSVPNVPGAKESFHVHLSDSLAALRPVVRASVGTTFLNVLAGASPNDFTTDSFDPGVYHGTPDVHVQAFSTDYHGTLDMADLASWVQKVFPDGRFLAAGPNSSYLFKRSLPGDKFSYFQQFDDSVPFVGGRQTGIDAQLSATLNSPINVSASPLAAINGVARPTFLDQVEIESISKEQSLPASIIDYRTLNLQTTYEVTFGTSGTKDFNDLELIPERHLDLGTIPLGVPVPVSLDFGVTADVHVAWQVQVGLQFGIDPQTQAVSLSLDSDQTFAKLDVNIVSAVDFGLTFDIPDPFRIGQLVGKFFNVPDDFVAFNVDATLNLNLDFHAEAHFGGPLDAIKVTSTELNGSLKSSLDVVLTATFAGEEIESNKDHPFTFNFPPVTFP